MDRLNADLLSEIEALNFFESNFLSDERFSKEFKSEARAQGLNYALTNLDANTRRCYRRYLEDHRTHPIVTTDLDFYFDFDKAHCRALGSLLHPDLRGHTSHTLAA